MLTTEASESAITDLSHGEIREQLDRLVQNHVFRSSKRSVQFLRYVVEQTLKGAADQIKERTIGVEVFGRDPSYDTNVDHVVRTAAIELRKRLAIYYGDESHRSELRMSIVPGSYIPRFTPRPVEPKLESKMTSGVALAALDLPVASEEIPPHRHEVLVSKKKIRWLVVGLGAFAVLALCVFGYRWFQVQNTDNWFWKPILDTPGSVLLAVGDVPNGPPTATTPEGAQRTPIPIIHKTSTTTVPFADAVTIARVMGILQSHGKKVNIRREGSSSFSDLREGPVVLVGAFNNEWSLRLTQQLRYTLALDAEKHLIYIKDTKNPTARNWSWQTDQPVDYQGEVGGPPLQDYALISRIWDSETGHVVVVIGGLYTYGTEAAGEFLSDPQLMRALAKTAPLNRSHKDLQIVLGTTVTDGTAGPPRILAIAD